MKKTYRATEEILLNNDDEDKPFTLLENFKAQAGYTIDELASMSPLEYELIRKKEAKRMDIRITVLDEEVKKLQTAPKITCNTAEDVEPWLGPVNGEELFRLIHDNLTAHIILPSGASIAITLWIILTYCFDAFLILPILTLLSPEKRCGKTTLLLLLNGLVNNGRLSSNISPAAVYRIVEKSEPTLLTDEADTFFKNNEELRGIYNSGHTREAAFIDRVNKETMEVERFSTWSPKAIAMIGKPKDTIIDRSIIVTMSRKKKGEVVQKKKLTHYNDSINIRRRAKRWATDNMEALKRIDVELPDLGNDRMTDNWTPLFSIAAVIGADLLGRTKESMMMLSNAHIEDDSIGSMLLVDIRETFQELNLDRIPSEELVNKLVAMEDRPWPEWRQGKSLTKTGLARLLKRFSIKTKKIRFTSGTLRGYEFEQFKETFSRYIPSSQTGTPEQYNDINKLNTFQTGTNKTNVPFKKEDKQLESLPCSTVPLQKVVSEGGRKSQPQLLKGEI